MLKEKLLNSNSWAIDEAKKILKRINNKTPEKGYVLLETGYGPSGLPHIGTFGEVARTTVVRFAFEQISGIKTRLFSFSDDMDGLRKVPDNVPNKELLFANLQKPLTSVPDPFCKYGSFGEHNNAMLKDFLNSFNFDYEFLSSTECYKKGMFDEALIRILEKYEEVKNVVLPTLGTERKQNYSPFLPVDEESGRVLQTEVLEVSPSKGTIVYLDESGNKKETSVLGGKCKLQWKVDWAMRWYVFNVDYEMSGKDLIPSVELSTKICKILGGIPPVTLSYELFLNEEGQKISKSKGNGISIEQWLKYGNKESLALFMYHKPKTAKRLYFDVIPRYIDEWMQLATSYNKCNNLEEKVNNPLYFLEQGKRPKINDYLSFNLIMNVVSTLGLEDKEQIWVYLDKYKVLDAESKEFMSNLIDKAVNYYNDFVKVNLHYKLPDEAEKLLLKDLKERLFSLSDDSTSEEIQTVIYKVGTDNKLDLKGWFNLLYQILLGQNEGPRMGSFFKIIGLKRTLELIDRALI